jgi:capsular exopolysaccharide synthesis family protein
VNVAEPLVSLLAPGSFAADQYRTLRHTIEQLRRNANLHVLAVTSPGPGDGKTVTTLNLAGSLAQSPDLRVLVIDTDLRRPSIGRYLGLPVDSRCGLADVIADSRLELGDAVVHLRPFNLSVLPAGFRESGFYELLNSPRVDGLLREARRLYDIVLVDTPPLLPLPDCRLLSRSVDAFLLVVAAHRTPRRMVSEATTLLDPAKLIGIVFNGDDRPAAGHYGKFGYYYAHSSDRQRTWWQRAWNQADRRSF